MRILQVTPGYFPSVGGVPQHVKNISERLAKVNAVTVFAGDPSGNLPGEEEINGVLVRRFKSFAPANAYHLSPDMARQLNKAEFDIVHGHSYHAFPLYFCRYAKRSRFVVTPHYHGRGHTPIRDILLRLYKALGKNIFLDADRVIAVSSYEKELLVKDFSLDESKISIIPNGVDLAEFANLAGQPKEPKTILCVGRLEKYKGVQYIIETLPLLDKGFHLEIVGKGPYRGRLIELIDKLGLNSRISFHQDLPREELIKIYARAGVFVLLSQHEAFSIVVAEALAAKTPCIVANKQWVDNKSSFGIDYPVNSDKLAELINKVAGKKVGDAKLWDWDEVTQQIAKLYQEWLN